MTAYFYIVYHISRAGDNQYLPEICKQNEKNPHYEV